MAYTLVLQAHWVQLQLSLAPHQHLVQAWDWHRQIGTMLGMLECSGHSHREVFTAGRWVTSPNWLGSKGAAATQLMKLQSTGLG